MPHPTFEATPRIHGAAGDEISNMRLLCALLLFVLLTSPLPATDWPQIHGPQRNGHVVQELPSTFPDGGPHVQWRYAVGEGQAGVAVVGDTVIVFHRPGNVERVEALSKADGASLWRSDAPTSYRGGILRDSGPRAVPVVQGNTVVTLGAGGRLRAHALADGKERWSVDLADVFSAPEGYFGFGSSPLVVETGERSLVIAMAGGDGGGVVAYDVATGELAWTAGKDRASYSSPIVATLGGTRQVIVPTRLHVLGLDPASGQELWRLPFGRKGPSAVAAAPVVSGQRLLLTAAYGVGGRLLDVSTPKPKEIWAGEALSSHYPTPIVLGAHVYGVSGREDHRDGVLRALELESGKVLWTEKGYGMVHLITDGQRLLAQRLDGTLDLIAADPKAFRRLDRAAVAEGPLRSQPALSGHVLFVRTTPESGSGEVVALSIR